MKKTMTRKKKRTRRTNSALLLLILAAACWSPASAQKEKKDQDAGTRIVQGQVFDADDKPVVGAVVQLKDMRSLQIRSFITEDEGKYHFSGLKTEVDYQLKALHNDLSSAPKTVSLFDTRKLAVLNLKLDKAEKDKK